MVQLFDSRSYLMARKRPLRSSLLHVMGVLLLEFVLERPVDTSASVIVTQPEMQDISKHCIREAAKKSTNALPPPISSLVATLFVIFFYRATKKFFFNSGQALTPPPLSGRATKKITFFVASLIKFK